MATTQSEAEAALEKLGERYRGGIAAQNPMPANSRDTVKDAVRAEWEREQEAAKAKLAEPPPPEKTPERSREHLEPEP